MQLLAASRTDIATGEFVVLPAKPSDLASGDWASHGVENNEQDSRAIARVQCRITVVDDFGMDFDGARRQAA